MLKYCATILLLYISLLTSSFASYSHTYGINGSIEFVDPISIAITDTNIKNVVGGDTINITRNLEISYDSDRNIGCALSYNGEVSTDNINVEFVNINNPLDKITLNIDINACSNILMTGIIPENADNNNIYSTSLSIIAAYITTIHS